MDGGKERLPQQLFITAKAWCSLSRCVGVCLKRNMSDLLSRHVHENGCWFVIVTLLKSWGHCVCVCVCHGWQLLSSCLVPFLLDIIRALFWTIVLEQIHPSVCYLRWKTKSVLVPGPLQRPPHAAGLTSMWRLSGMLDTEKGRGVR